MKKIVNLLLLISLISSCGPKLDGGRKNTRLSAQTLISEKIDLDNHRAHLVVPEFPVKIFKELDYFEKVLAGDAFLAEMREDGFDTVTSLSHATAQKIHQKYKPFLFAKLTYSLEPTGILHGTLELFCADKPQPIFKSVVPITGGVNLQEIEALVVEMGKYIEANSQFYKSPYRP